MPTRARKPQPVFRVREGSRLKQRDALIVGRELIRLERSAPLTPGRLVAEAKSRTSVLHGYFEWDDTLAAEKYRLDQARHLLRSVVVEYDRPQGKVDVRYWYNVRNVDDGGERIYACKERIERDPRLRAQVLEQAKSALNYWRKTYGHYEELFPLVQAIDRGLDEIG